MKLKLTEAERFEDIRSGSAIEYRDRQIFVAGDDARCVYVLGEDRRRTKTIRLLEGALDERIPKKHKPDIEAMALIDPGPRPALLLLGSGSRDRRNVGFVVDIGNEQVRQIALDVFYDRLRDSGLPDLNIEGAAVVGDRMVLGNRGHKRHPANQIIVTDLDFYDRQERAAVRILTLAMESPHAQSGISGLAYSRTHACLIVTLSTEDVANTYDDGEIGASYLAFLRHPAERLQSAQATVRCDEYVDLTAVDQKFAGQKVESVCIQSESADGMWLYLVADNDSGDTHLFELALTL